jgi:hypothetical protein
MENSFELAGSGVSSTGLSFVLAGLATSPVAGGGSACGFSEAGISACGVWLEVLSFPPDVHETIANTSIAANVMIEMRMVVLVIIFLLLYSINMVIIDCLMG